MTEADGGIRDAWTVAPGLITPDGRKLLSGRDRAVLHCPDAPMTCEPADQALIAAAPDLLAALTALLADVHGVSDIDTRPLAEAAIAKAEGRS